MKILFAAMLAIAAAPLNAQAAPAPAPAAATAKFTLDTPIETLVADEKAKAVLVADLPKLLVHPNYEMFKGMSLNQLMPYSEGALTADLLAKVAADLAAIK